MASGNISSGKGSPMKGRALRKMMGGVLTTGLMEPNYITLALALLGWLNY